MHAAVKKQPKHVGDRRSQGMTGRGSMATSRRRGAKSLRACSLRFFCCHEISNKRTFHGGMPGKVDTRLEFVEDLSCGSLRIPGNVVALPSFQHMSNSLLGYSGQTV